MTASHPTFFMSVASSVMARPSRVAGSAVPPTRWIGKRVGSSDSPACDPLSERLRPLEDREPVREGPIEFGIVARNRR